MEQAQSVHYETKSNGAKLVVDWQEMINVDFVRLLFTKSSLSQEGTVKNSAHCGPLLSRKAPSTWCDPTCSPNHNTVSTNQKAAVRFRWWRGGATRLWRGPARWRRCRALQPSAVGLFLPTNVALWALWTTSQSLWNTRERLWSNVGDFQHQHHFSISANLIKYV